MSLPDHGKIRLLPALLSVLISGFLCAAGYLLFLQTPFTPKREILFAFLLFAVFLPLNYLFIWRFLLPKTRSLNGWAVAGFLFGSAIFATELIVTLPRPVIYSMLPQHTLEISIPPVGPSQPPTQLTLNWFTTSLGDISFSRLITTGVWENSDEGLTSLGQKAASLRWTGKTGSFADLFFSSDSNLDQVGVRWDGVELTMSSAQSSDGLIRIPWQFMIPPVIPILTGLIFWFSIFYVTLGLTLYLVSVHFIENRSKGIPSSHFGAEVEARLREEKPARSKALWVTLWLSLLLIVAAIPLLAHSFLGSFARMVADDYCSAGMALAEGVFRTVLIRYSEWSGRFSASFLDASAGMLGPSVTRISPAVIMSLWLASLFWLANQANNLGTRITKYLGSGLLAVMIQVAVLQIAPSINQSLYWGQGMRSVVPPLILATLQAGIFFSLGKDQNKPRRSSVWFAFMIGLAFITAGFSETFTFMYLVILIIALLGVAQFSAAPQKTFLRQMIIAALVGTLLGFALMAAAPGNQVRQGQLVQQSNMVGILAMAFQSMTEYAGMIFHSGENFLSLGLVVAFSLLIGNPFSISHKKDEPFDGPAALALLYHLPIFTILLIFSCFIPAAYTMSKAPPLRTDIIPGYVLVLGLASWGYTLGKVLAPQLRKVLSWPRNPSAAPGGRISPLWAILLLFMVSVNSIWIVSQDIGKVAEFRSFAQSWDQMNSEIVEARKRNETAVSIHPPPEPYELGFGNEGDWINLCMNEYYRIEIRYLP